MPAIDKLSILGRESIFVGSNIIEHAVDDIAATLRSSRHVIVTDHNIAKYHLGDWRRALQKSLGKLQDDEIPVYLVPPGESSKTRKTKEDIEDWMLRLHCGRDTVLIAIGGGVIGDMCGFVAATYMRGIRFVQVPTTLLAMVDSSIGGKTAVDTPAGKNLIGAFWQPERIFIELRFLDTLPLREFSNGMAEVIKTAAIADSGDFAYIEDNADLVMSTLRSEGRPGGVENILRKFVKSSASIKSRIVSTDEKESGLRNLLNFGHSVGHSYEAMLFPRVLHGECVSFGMIKECEISRDLGVLSSAALGRLAKCLKAYGLPTSLRELPGSSDCSVERLLDIMRVDKKNEGPKKKIVLLKDIGETLENEATFVTDEVITRVLSPDVAICPTLLPDGFHVSLSPPGSKSITNRALILAALGSGTCRLQNILHSDDTQYMMSALTSLGGSQFSFENNGRTLVVEGKSGHFGLPAGPLYIGNAGTASRFLTALCTILEGHPEGGAICLRGNARMHERPIAPLVDALRQNGCSIGYGCSTGSLPLEIVPQGLNGGVIELQATISSQYVSAILMCAPYAKSKVTLKLVGGQPISRLYIDMTLAMMKSFGIEVVVSGQDRNTFEIPKGCYRNPGEYVVESDASSATYPLAVAAVTGTSCTVQNIGANSLQGDAFFAQRVLAKMGCEIKVSNSDIYLKGPPKGGLKSLGDIDMEEMTDAFLTACAVAAVAKDKENNSSTIRGIANQRVKECNRIEAMVSQLRNFGVEAREHEDGLTIHGNDISRLRATSTIHTYDDHRVAMSLSVLACVCPNKSVIADKGCVEKTWPGWWAVLHNDFKIRLVGEQAALGPSPSQKERLGLKLVMIGMRGSGKTTIGTLAAKMLAVDFLDMDSHLEVCEGRKITQIIQEDGWDYFRERERALFLEAATKPSQSIVISCGGGVVESEQMRSLLRSTEYNLKVIHIRRNIQDILEYLERDSSRPSYVSEHPREVWKRRRLLYQECSQYDFFGPDVKNTPTLESDISTGLRPLLMSITASHEESQASRVTKEPSLMLSLTKYDHVTLCSNLSIACSGCSALEIHADQLELDLASDEATANKVIEIVSLIRSLSSLPLVFTLRTVSQGGSFPDDNVALAQVMYRAAIRLGVELLDIQASWPDAFRQEIAQSRLNSSLIISENDVCRKDEPANPRWKDIIAGNPTAAVFKFTGSADWMGSIADISSFRARIQQSTNVPLIVYKTGYSGRLAQALNKILTPVYDEQLTSGMQDAQFSMRDLNLTRSSIGQLPAQKFYLFGTPIQHSKSPTIHNHLFRHFGLPHHYELFDSNDFASCCKVMRRKEFGGGSVTIPHKLAAMREVDEVSEDVKTIGAINTIVRKLSDCGSREILRGENTDWMGIYRTVMRLAGISTGAGLVIGSGGTSRAAVYAFHKAGISPIYMVNRTQSAIKDIVSAFPNIDIIGIESAEQARRLPPVVASLSAVPADKDLDSKIREIVSVMLPQPGKVFVDMAYKPQFTPLMALATEHKWQHVVPGLAILLEQALGQFALWTGIDPPRQVAEKALA